MAGMDGPLRAGAGLMEPSRHQLNLTPNLIHLKQGVIDFRNRPISERRLTRMAVKTVQSQITTNDKNQTNIYNVLDSRLERVLFSV